MATCLHIRFLTGRAHLHPWHAAPNEGRVEWPPSPWRLLRALVAVAGRGLTTLPDPGHDGVIANDWFKSTASGTKRRSTKRHRASSDSFWVDHADLLPFRTLAALLHKLTALPVVWLPRTGVGHTRHFFRVASGRPSKNKPEEWKWESSTGSAVFDTFAAVDALQPLVFQWPNIDLAQEEEVQLKRLLARLLYFGRSESWCEADLERGPFESGEMHWPSVAIEDEPAFARLFKREGFREHRDYTIEKRLAWDPNQAAFLHERFHAPKSDEPELLVRALVQQSGDSMKHGDRPWGTRWVRYAVRRDVFRLPVRHGVAHRRDAGAELQPIPKRQVLRYTINTATVHRATLPPITATLPIAQRCRAAAMAVFGRQNGGLCSPQLTGKRFRQDDRRYELFAESDHDAVTKFGNGDDTHSAHAYWWPVDEDCDGFIDHLIVLCEAGFSTKDLAALRALSRVGPDGSRADLLLTPVFEGNLQECRSSILQRNGTTRDFVSATPYFCPIHLTRRSGKKRSLKGHIQQSLAKIDMPVADRIDEIVFDYDLSSLGHLGMRDPRQRLIAHVREDLHGASADVVVERGGFVVAQLDAPLASPAIDLANARYPSACVRNPDERSPLGLARGLFVGNGTFVPALAFHRVRTADDRAKGPGVMLRIQFDAARPARPFAIGQFCHFGLGLFVPSAQ